MIKKVALGIVSVLIVLVLATTVLIPVADDASKQSTIYNNNDDATYWELSEVTNTTISKAANSMITTVGDETFQATTSREILVLTDSFVVLHDINQLIFCKNNKTSPSTISSTGTFSATLTDGTATINNNGTEVTLTYTWGYIADTDGKFIQGKNSRTYYVESAADVSTFEFTSAKGLWTYHDGVTSTTEIVAVPTLSPVEGTDGAVQTLEGITFTYDGTDTGHTGTLIVAPAEIVITTETQSAISSLIMIIPFLVIVGIVLTAVGTFIVRREY